MSKKGYKKLKSAKGVYKNETSSNFLARKNIKGKNHQKTFSTLFEAKRWVRNFDGTKVIKSTLEESDFSTLEDVWEMMQKVHFPTLATSTKAIWIRRFVHWKRVEHLTMDKITPSLVTK
jgi:6-pyruvoyl-tetrahydropterin synthase